MDSVYENELLRHVNKMNHASGVCACFAAGYAALNAIALREARARALPEAVSAETELSDARFRDECAMRFAVAMIASSGIVEAPADKVPIGTNNARIAYVLAEAMLAERKRRQDARGTERAVVTVTKARLAEALDTAQRDLDGYKGASPAPFTLEPMSAREVRWLADALFTELQKTHASTGE